LGMLRRAGQRFAAGNTRLSRGAITALATSALVWGVMTAQVPVIAQAKAPLAPTGRVSNLEWRVWDSLKVHGGMEFIRGKEGMPREEEICSQVDSQNPASVSNWESMMHEQYVRGARYLVEKYWEPMAVWGRGLRARRRSYPRAKRYLVSSASKEIALGAGYMALAFGDFAEAYEGLADLNCNQTAKMTIADAEYSVGFPMLSKGFASLEKAGFGKKGK
jgi:hypothetical protein